MANTIGKLFTFTSFGESHGKAIGGIVDGCPAGITLDEVFIQNELNRRRPGQSSIATPRKEEDKVEFLSGVFEGTTTGTPIAFVIWNANQRSGDYDHLKEVYRPSHADYTYQQKYGVRDYRGGGRSSARETASRVVAGAIAKLALKQKADISITAFTSQVGHIAMRQAVDTIDLNQIESNIVRCPEKETAGQMIDYIQQLKKEGDSIGGVVSCVIKNMPVGVGEPIFDKVQSRLAQAMLSINAAHGFDYGAGFSGVAQKGSEMNDSFLKTEKGIATKTNNSGGVQGGISNGEDIYFRVLFKPVATISKKQQTVDIHSNAVELEARGRHDPCVLPRAVPIVEAMAAITLLDLYLNSSAYK